MANVKVAMSKKGMLIALVIGVLLLGGGGGYLLWRVNQEDTVAPTDSDASETKWCTRCKPGECVNGKGYSSLANCVETEKNPDKCVGCGDGVRYCGIGVTERYECGTSAYHITYVAGEGGTVTKAGKNNVSPGGSISSTATPNSGYEFEKWSDGKTTAARTDSNVQADATYTATFKKEADPVVQYTLSAIAKPEEAGKVLHNGTDMTNKSALLNAGSSYSLSAVANTGYKFVKWTKKYPPSDTEEKVEEFETDANTTRNIDKDIILIANFEKTSTTDPAPKIYKLTAKVNPSVSGASVVISGGDKTKEETIPTPDKGDVEVTQGQSYTITAKIPAGYKFVKWTKQYDGGTEEQVIEQELMNPTNRGFDKNITFIANISLSSSNTCGDGVCSAEETSVTCPIDCGSDSICGDGVCSADETSSSCPVDCNGGGGNYNGDGAVPNTAIFEDTKDTIIFGIVVLMIGIGWTWISTLPKRAYLSISKASSEIISNTKAAREKDARESRRNRLERKLK